jgi:hypothetical protein
MRVLLKKPGQFAVGSATQSGAGLLDLNFLNSDATLSNTITHSRAGNATMVDSDGLIKWAPHNLVTYSEDFTQWVVSRLDVAASSYNTIGGAKLSQQSGQTTAGVVQQQGFTGDGNWTFSVLAKKGTNRNFLRLNDFNAATSNTRYTYFNLDAGAAATTDAAHTASVIDFGDGWFLCSISFEIRSGNNNFGIFVCETDNSLTVTDDQGFIYVAAPHLYRSDLGGMAPVPAGERSFPSASTYVPTTSSARYLPRVGHHVYNGSAWVNEGVLAESEARTNLLTYSEDLSDAAWTKRSGVTIGTPVTRNGISLDLIENDGAGNFRLVTQSVGSVADGAYLTFSCFIEAGTSTETAIRVDDIVIGASSNQVTVPITWTSGVPSLEAAITAGLTFVDASLQDWEDGVYRVHLTVLNGTGGALTLYPKYYVQWDDTAAAVNTYAGGFQAEIAPTPSSYIPTAGSTVTRAAETFTIPAANLPWPTETYGPELVTNGTFDTDVSGWTAVNSTLSLSSNALSVADAGSFSAAYQAISTEIGKAYLLSLDCVSKTGDDFVYGWGDAIPDGATYYASQDVVAQTVSGSYTLDFVAVSTTTYISVGSQATRTAVYDNISVRELTRYPVSIQMNGRLSYADEGSAGQVTYAQWEDDTNNRITLSLDTDSTATGEVNFTQVEGGTADTVASSATEYAPGILVPFNIASRHGMTFVNGAVDGVALTADTTPTNLPDLSATDLDLAYDYMGTVERFRVWGVDLGDDGIENATTGEPASYLIWDQANDDYVQRIFQ